MKRIMTALVFGLLLAPSASQAIEEVATLPDGSMVYRCEYNGSGHKVQVKYLGAGEYLVLRRGSSATGESGRIKVPSAIEAAKRGCGE